MLYKKCRIKWIPDGDANTIFSMLWLIGEEEQTAKGLPINGCWVKEPEKVKEKGSNFFCNRLWEERDQWVNLEGIQLNLYVRLIIQCYWRHSLKKRLKMQCECDGNKSPGPDGYNFNFIKAC